ncbi:GDSL-type esterase/lipase family protein [Streptomyces sp. NPDC056508]|uniref:GDSL-type esterase/lipase family protein n=1 Tax=Streptomyces sp. NPDC056508 TaxID=3345845 RepID=UPI0036AE8062
MPAAGTHFGLIDESWCPTVSQKVRHEYDRMLEVLHKRAPHARILAVGCPAVVPQDASSCNYGDLTPFGTVTPGDLDWLREDVLEPLNRAIDSSTNAQGAAGVVDLYDSSRNHSVCGNSEWVEGFVALPDQLSFVHPNALGHRNAADHVEEAMLNAIS